MGVPKTSIKTAFDFKSVLRVLLRPSLRHTGQGSAPGGPVICGLFEHEHGHGTFLQAPICTYRYEPSGCHIM